IDIYAVPFNTFSPNATATWGPNTAGSLLLYSSTIINGTTIQGPQGDQSFSGQPATGQNQASFFAATGVSSVSAVLVQNGTPVLPPTQATGTLFAPPENFTGFQAELKELNGLTGGGTNNPEKYPSSGFPTNADLDFNFSTLAAQYPGLGLTTGQ